MWKRLLSGLSVLVLAACNLNMAPGTTNETITGPPQVQIMSPLPNATYLENVAVNIQVLVSNAGADIDRVEFAVDDTIIATGTAPNEAGVPSFSVEQSWQAQAAGTHQISVTAFRGDGSSSAPASVSVSVVAQVGQPQDNTANGNSTSVPTPQPSHGPIKQQQSADSAANGHADDSGGSDQYAAAHRQPDAQRADGDLPDRRECAVRPQHAV